MQASPGNSMADSEKEPGLRFYLRREPQHDVLDRYRDFGEG